MAVLSSPFHPEIKQGAVEGLAGTDCAPPDFCEQTEAVTWLHIGHMNFIPSEPSCQMLEVSARQPAVSSLTALRATGRFVSAQPCVASMRMDCMWFGRLFALWSSEYPLAEVQASDVWITSLMKPVLFWTAVKRMRKADPSATGRGRGRGDVPPIAHAPLLEGEVGGDQSGSDLEGGDVRGQ